MGGDGSEHLQTPSCSSAPLRFARLSRCDNQKVNGPPIAFRTALEQMGRHDKRRTRFRVRRNDSTGPQFNIRGRKATMFQSLLRFFGLAKKSSELEFDPLYGLPRQSLEGWLSRNPKLKKDYASQLAARSRHNHRRVASGSSRNDTVVC
jgi:hypothetical protein